MRNVSSVPDLPLSRELRSSRSIFISQAHLLEGRVGGTSAGTWSESGASRARDEFFRFPEPSKAVRAWMGFDDAFPRTSFRLLRQVLAVRARVQVRAALLAECQPEQLGAGEGRLRERGREASGFAADASPGRCDEVAGTSSTGAAKAATASRERRNHIVFTLFSRGVGTGANPRCETSPKVAFQQ